MPGGAAPPDGRRAVEGRGSFPSPRTGRQDSVAPSLWLWKRWSLASPLTLPSEAIAFSQGGLPGRAQCEDRDVRAHRSAPRAQSARLPPAPLTSLRHGCVSAAHSCASQEPEWPQTTQLSTRAFRMEVSVGPVLLVTLETNTIQQSVLLQTDVLVGWSPQGQREGQSVARRPHPSGLRSSSGDREKATVRGPLRSHR